MVSIALAHLVAWSFGAAFQDPPAPVTPPPAVEAESQPKRWTLRVKGKVGDKYIYAFKMSMESTQPSGSYTMESVITETLARVYEEQQDWTTVMTLRNSNATPIFRDLQEIFEIINRVPVISVRTDLGRILKSVVGEEEVNSRGEAAVVFPKDPVAIGDLWDAPIEVGEKVYQIRYGLKEVRQVKGRETAIIYGAYLPGQGVTVNAKTVFWVDVPSGRTIYASIDNTVTEKGIALRLRSESTLTESKAGT